MKESDVVLKESDMAVKEIGVIKHDGSRVVAGCLGPKAPDKCKDKDAIFVAHIKTPEDMNPYSVEGYALKKEDIENRCLAVLEKDGSFHLLNTYQNSFDSISLHKPFRDMQHATHQASAYVSMLNSMSKQEWQREWPLDRRGETLSPWHRNPYRNTESLFAKNMLAGDDWIALTHRKDLKVAIPMTGSDDGDDYGGTVYYNRVYPKRSVTGQCIEVTEHGAKMSIKDFGVAHVQTGFKVSDDERKLMQQAVSTKTPMQLAVSLDGKAVMVNAGELGKVVTKHNDVAIPHLFCEMDCPSLDYARDAIVSGKLVHVYDNRSGLGLLDNPNSPSGLLELERKKDGKHVLLLMGLAQEQGKAAIESAKSMEGHIVNLTFDDKGRLFGVRDLSQERGLNNKYDKVHSFGVRDLSKKGGLSL